MIRRYTGWDHLDEDQLDDSGDINRRHAPAWSNDRLEQLITENLGAFPETSTIRTFSQLGILGGMIDSMRPLGNTPEFIVFRLIEQAKSESRMVQASDYEARRKALAAAEKAAQDAAEAEARSLETPAAPPLPTLIGTEKQVAWAMSIREVAQLQEPGLPELLTATRAAWWIDNKARWAMRRARVSDADLLDSGRSDDLERFQRRQARRDWNKNEF